MNTYPLDIPPDEDPRAPVRRPQRSGFAADMAQLAADAALWLVDLRRRRRDLVHFIESMLLILIGVGLVTLAGITDVYLHRGVETGTEGVGGGTTTDYVVHPSGRELATNVDLRLFPVEEAADVAQTLADSGYQYARQEISWADIESEQGSFDWSTYDDVIGALANEGIGVIAVIVDAPTWSHAEDATAGEQAPPADPAELQTFMTEFTSHFGNRVPFVQIWDQPNTAANWGGTPATGTDFQPYLSAGFYGARNGNPEVRIVTPELAIESDVPAGMGDLAFLASLYGAGAEPVFDVVGMRLDGGQNSPDDRTVSADRPNFSRAILFRELMIDHGDQETPVWATTYGWAAGANVSREEQSEYVVRGLNRAWSEWPWMGLMVQWAFATPADSAQAPYAIAPQGEPTPLYERLNDPALISRSNVANTGFAPMDADAVTYQGNWANQHLEFRTFRTTSQVGSTATFQFQGTGLIAFVRSGPQSGPFRVEVDGEVIPGDYADDPELWSMYYAFSTADVPLRLVSGLDDEVHTIRITLSAPGELTIGGLVVEREPPFIWPVMLLTASAALVLFLGLRSFVYFIAIRAGHIVRRDDVVEPSLPSMPDWAPDRRL